MDENCSIDTIQIGVIIFLAIKISIVKKVNKSKYFDQGGI
jgi:hypothetical protein